jgi:hypothetical protein
MAKYARGKYVIKNPSKYGGNKSPTYRSSWEWAFMQFCDNHPGVVQWSSEAVKIPYKNPLTNRNTIYVPDFLVVYSDKKGNRHAEVIEVKPKKETDIKSAGRNPITQAKVINNLAKWEAARAWCKQNNLQFRIVTEEDIFHRPQKR